MAKDLTFCHHYYEITLNKPTDKFHILPISDIHHDTPNCDRKKWLAFLRDVKPRMKKDNIFFLGGGDWHDFMSWSERRKIRNADLHESTIARMDRAALRDTTKLLDEIWFTRDRWLGLVSGNHKWVFSTDGMEGISADEYMAAKLGCPHLGDLAYISISVKFKNTKKASKVDIVLCHGKAGGKLLGSSINQIEDLRPIFPNADIYIMGHDHRRAAIPVEYLKCKKVHTKKEMQLQACEYWLARSGSFLRGYVPNKQSYVVKGLLRPTSLGVVEFEVSFKRTSRNGPMAKEIHVTY